MNKLNQKDDEVLAHARLMLNLNSPPLEDCWSEGYDAAINAEDESSNPYSKNTTENEHWNEGWWSGFYGEPRLYPSLIQEEIEDSSLSPSKAANEAIWTHESKKHWANNVFVIAGTIAATVAIVELLEMVV